MRWQSEITVWEPPHRFVDEQRRGPYRLWRHEHDFVERDGGTVIRDRVQLRHSIRSHHPPVVRAPGHRTYFRLSRQKMRELFPAPKPETMAKSFPSSGGSVELQSRFPSSVLDQSDAFCFKKIGIAGWAFLWETIATLRQPMLNKVARDTIE